jgi:hypothetical protein
MEKRGAPLSKHPDIREGDQRQSMIFKTKFNPN